MAEQTIKNDKDLILSIIATGEDLSPSLIKFASKWDEGGQYKFIANLAVSVSTITTLLSDMADATEKDGDDAAIESSVTRRLCEGIDVDFKKLSEALKKANVKAGPGRFVTKERQLFHAFKKDGEFGLLKDPEYRVGMADQSFLAERINGIQLLRAELEPDHFIHDRLNEAKGHLWYLYEGLRFLALRKRDKEGRLEADDKTEMVKLVEQLPTILAELELSRKFILLDTAELNTAENRQREVQRAGRSARVVDDDARSIVSVNTVASYQFLDVNEVYEAWVIRKFDGEKNWPGRSWSLGWFRVHETYDISGYEVESQAMTIDQIKEASEIVEAGDFKPKQAIIVADTLTTLPPGVQREIKLIVEDRMRASTNSRFTRKWKIVDIIKKDKVQGPVPVWMMLSRGEPAFSEALFILKGETADKEDPVRPSRHEDAFRKPEFRRGYFQEPIVNREYPHEIVVERRPQAPRHRQGGIGTAGRVTEISEPPSLEDAEAKIHVILAGTATSHKEEDEALVSDEVMV